jgi:glycosyltransferase involved in cell wall biosynthesis
MAQRGDPVRDNRQSNAPTRRVTFVNRFFYPDLSATAQILTDLALHLAQAGWEVTIVTSRSAGPGRPPAASHETWRGIRIRRVRSTDLGRRFALYRLLDFASFYLLAFITLLAVVRRGEIVVAKTDPPLISVLANMACGIKGGRLVNWLQDLYPEVAEELQTPLVRGPVAATLRALRNASLRSAVANVAIGKLMKRRIVANGAAADRVQVIPNWADEQAIRPTASNATRSRGRWGFGDQHFVLGYSGNLGRAHEANTLLAAAQLLRGRPDIHFLVIGGGAENARLRSEAAQQGLTQFRFEPHQPREDLEDSLAAADAHWISLRPELEGLIVPSKFYGILAAARPVIAICSLEGELAPELARLGCGIAVAPGDGEGLARAIIQLADSPDARHQMGAKARRAIDEEFAKAATLIRWQRLLDDVNKDGIEA